jgi:hypothetical protein
MEKIDLILEESFRNLRRYKNVLNISTGEELRNGVKTGRKAIVVYVSRKLKLDKLEKKDQLPDEVGGVPVDVVEISSDYELGDTSPSHLLPIVQRIISSGVRKDDKKRS